MKSAPANRAQRRAWLHGDNLAYLESLQRDAQGRRDAKGNGAWARLAAELSSDSPASPDSFASLDSLESRASNAHAQTWSASSAHKQAQVSLLIDAYRSFGHLRADIDPIGVMPRGDASELDLTRFDLNEAALTDEFDVGNLGGGGHKPLGAILEHLRKVYCGAIGYEVAQVTSREQRRWLRERIECRSSMAPLDDEECITLLQRLSAAEGLEKYLHTKYVGQKRFSLEGGDVLVPMLADMIQQLGARAVKEIVIGMAHRGRLNVLVNILGKAPKELFSEFEGRGVDVNIDVEAQTGGDVKYHQGASSDIQTPGGRVHVALSFNPSHLEIIDPVVEGSVRARQERRRDSARAEVAPILIHGDAAFAGQGVVMETLNMSRTRGYSTGGTIHIIINNQIGFTTNALDARSTLYCTEVAKMVQAPIFHVNGDDPEATVRAARLALDYRMTFGNDAVIDIVCYRRHGHNEADEPSITQPMMYGKIKQAAPPRKIYADRLIARGAIARDRADAMADAYRAQLDDGHIVAGQVIDPNKAAMMIDWTPYLGGDWDDGTATATQHSLPQLAQQLSETPDDFIVHARVQKVLAQRIAMARGETPIDWGCAELLAYATILKDGYDVRLSGQDAGRGTFSHRHATLHDQSQARTHIPLQHLGGDGRYLVINSLLSEEAVLAFEYGYATTEPRALVIWEGQFGDFANGAQVVIDQFISSGQAKWSRVCGLTLFLPHGMEGQGPEHSSARLERFLQLCAEQNMQVCTPTTPAQMFHLLRRQILRALRRPLIVMTPKSLLRHKLATSTPSELSDGKFHNVLGEVDALDAKRATRIVLCNGKVYYDLLEARRRAGSDEKIDAAAANIVLLRIEQLYPFPRRDLRAMFEHYPRAREIVWCQEEPNNQGAWRQIHRRLRDCLTRGQTLHCVSRAASPSPAVGHYQLHVAQQQRLVERALGALSAVDDA